MDDGYERPGTVARLLRALTATVTSASPVELAIRSCLDDVCTHFGWPVGHLDLVMPDDGSELVPSAIWHLGDPQRFAGFRRVTEALRLRPGEGPPGQALATGRPVWIADLAAADNFPRTARAAEAGLAAGFAVPVLVGTEVAGVLEFFVAEPAEPDEGLLETMAEVASVMAPVVARARPSPALWESEERMRLVVRRPATPSWGWTLTALSPSGTRPPRPSSAGPGWRPSVAGWPTRSFQCVTARPTTRAWPGSWPPARGRCSGDGSSWRRSIARVTRSPWSCRCGRDGAPACSSTPSSTTSASAAGPRPLSPRPRPWSVPPSRTPPSASRWSVWTGATSRSTPALCRLTGYREVERVGRSFRDLTHPDDRGPDEVELARLLAGKTEHYQAEKRYLRADGHPVWVAVHASVVRDDAGRPSHFVGQVVDISDRRRAAAALAEANEQLRQANQLKDHFVAVTTHELRSPVTSIMGFADLLQDQWARLADEERLGCIVRIGRQSRRLDRLVRDLLTLATIEAGALHLSAELVPVANAVVEAITEVGLEGVQVSAPAGVVVWADGDRLRQILVNFLTNAAKYGPEPISVEADVEADAVVVTVADRGPGVPGGFVDRLFDTFTQASTGPTRGGRGTGLGLAIVRRLAEAQGGAAWYEPNPGGRAPFRVRLPTRPVGEGTDTGPDLAPR